MNTPQPCKCGQEPAILTCHDGPEPALQLACKCGRHGALIRYRTEAEKALAQQAAIDGWNIGFSDFW
jgi:hypothetical protein